MPGLFHVSGIPSTSADTDLRRDRYPETAGKTIEEIEEMFSKGGPRPWKTKPGNSKLDERMVQVMADKLGVNDITSLHVERRNSEKA